MACYNAQESPVKISVVGPCFGDLVPEDRQLRLTLAFSNVDYSCKSKNILANVWGRAQPGELLAIMGPSGSGKTTLLNALSGRERVKQGAITLNGRKLNKNLKRHIAFSTQQDQFISSLTLGYTLEFHAQMRMPSYLNDKQKKDFKDRITSLLKLDNPVLLNTRMGDVLKRGISGGEMKRANIACEMFSMPAVLLVDEPTTGLDSHNALNVIQVLKEYAVKNSITVVVTVHQPSSRMFRMFDKLLLMAEGKVAYFGDRNDVIPKFEELGMIMEPEFNPADFIMDQVYDKNKLEKLLEAAQNSSERTPVILQTQVRESNNGTENVVCSEGGPESGQDSGRSSMSIMPLGNDGKWPISYWKQVRLLTVRSFKEGTSRSLSWLNFLNYFVLSFASGALWWGTRRTEEYISEIQSWGYFSNSIFLLSSTFETITLFPVERAVINKERASGMYALSAYYFAKMVGEILPACLYPTIYLIASYACLGITSATTFFCQWLILILCAFASQSVGLFAGSICQDIKKLMIFCSLYCLPNILFGGYFATIPPEISGIRYTSTLYYAYDAMQIVEFHYGSPIMCGDGKSIYEACSNETFIPPSDIVQTWPDPFFSLLIRISFLFVYNIVFRLLAYLALKYYKSPTRTI